MDSREEKVRFDRESQDLVSDNTKQASGYQGHGHREHNRYNRERGDRDGQYQKKNSRYGGQGEYHKKREAGGNKRDTEEREDKSEEKQQLGIVIQKKSVKSKKQRAPHKEYTKKSEQVGQEDHHPAEKSETQKDSVQSDPTAADKTVDIPLSDA